jgi:hypothetical protein
MEDQHQIDTPALPVQGRHHTEATKARLSEFARGRRASAETRAKMSESQRIRQSNPEIRAQLAERARGRTHSEETKQKLREINVGRKHTDEARQKIADAGRGRVVSDETRAKLSAIRKGKPRDTSYMHTPEARAKKSAALTGRKMSDETKAKISAAAKSKPRSEKQIEALKRTHERLRGYKHPPEFGEAISQRTKGRKMSDETKAKLSAAHKGVKHGPLPEETRRKISEAERGEKHHNWQGGKTEQNAIDRQSVEYKLWREAVYRRDHYTCRLCGVKSRNLCPHHIKSWARHEDIRYEVDNGITLCKTCHDAHHAKSGGPLAEPLPIDPTVLITPEEYVRRTASKAEAYAVAAPKISAALKGKPKSAEHRAKLSAAKRNISAETREKMAAAKRGRSLSQEHKDKIAESNKGKHSDVSYLQTDDVKAKRNAALKGQKRTPEQIERMRVAAQNRSKDTSATKSLEAKAKCKATWEAKRAAKLAATEQPTLEIA